MAQIRRPETDRNHQALDEIMQQFVRGYASFCSSVRDIYEEEAEVGTVEADIAVSATSLNDTTA